MESRTGKRLQSGPFVVLVLALLAAFIPGKAATRLIDGQGNLYLASSPDTGGAALTPNAFQRTFQSAVCGYYYIPGPHGTAGTSLPIACRHGYIQKISADGSTLLVGTNLGGSKDDVIGAIAVDSDGKIHVGGWTTSPDFPVTSGAYQTKQTDSRRSFLSILSPDGSKLLYSSFFDFGSVSALLTDRAGHVLIAGSTSAGGFPATLPWVTNNETGRNDAFVARFDPSLSKLEFATRFGGSMEDILSVAALDRSGNLYVAGYTSSTPRSAASSKAQPYTAFPVTPGAFRKLDGWANVFVVKLDSSGSILFSSVFGGTRYEISASLSLDSAGNAYITGTTESTDFPVTPGAFRSVHSPAFAAKLSSDGSRLLYSTFLGATGPSDTAVDSADNLLVIGFLPYSFNFPTTPDALQPCLNAAQSQRGADYFLQMDSDGAKVIYATFLPTSFVLPASSSGLIALDSNARVLIRSRTKLFDIFDARSRPPQGITCVANAATYRSGAIAPGEVVTIFGPSIGPKEPAHFRLTGGLVDSYLGGVSVYFNGIAAPLLYVSENQINAVVPFGVAGWEQSSVQIVNQGVILPSVTVPVANSAVGIFTLDSSGSGQAAVLNEDGSLNDYAHPARGGSVVSVFVTGAGRMQPSLPDGSLGEGRTTPAQPSSARLGARELETLYVGDAPGLVQGVVQMNLRIPAGFYRHGYVELDIRFGGWDPAAPRQALVYLTVE